MDSSLLDTAAPRPSVTGALVPASPPAFDAKLADKRRRLIAWQTNKSLEVEEQRKARQYYHDKQWTDEQIEALNRRKQPVIWSNRIKRKIDFLVGVEQRMRRDPKGYPRNPSGAHSADIGTAGLRYACDVNRWESIASDCTHDGLVSGIGLVWVGIESGSTGPDPKLKIGQVDRFFYDPRAVRPDFSDARYLGLQLWIDIEEAAERWPDSEEKMRNLLDRDNTLTMTRTDRDRSYQWADFEHRRVRIVEFWDKTRNGWEYCFFCGDELLEGGISPYKDTDGRPDCPWVAWTPYVDERGDRYGVIRSMIPIQDEINKRRSKLLHMLNVRQLFVTPGAADDIDKMRAELSRPDGIIEIPGGSQWGKDIGIIDQADQIRGQAELLTEAKAELENLGPNPGLIGKGGGIADQSGRAILAQRDSGMTELSPVFDRLRDFKLRVYRKLWARMKQAWQGEKWIRVSDYDDAPQFVGLNVFETDPMTQTARVGAVKMGEGDPVHVPGHLADIDIDIIMEEGPDTITMTEELLEKLAQLGQGAVPPKVLIELSDVPNKDRLMKLMDEAAAPPPEMQAMQKRMDELEAMLKAADVDVKRSTVEKNRADAISKLASIQVPPMMAGQQFPMPYREPLEMDEGAGHEAVEQIPQGGLGAPPPMDAAEMPLGQPDHGAVTLPMGAPGALPVNPNA